MGSAVFDVGLWDESAGTQVGTVWLPISNAGTFVDDGKDTLISGGNPSFLGASVTIGAVTGVTWAAEGLKGCFDGLGRSGGLLVDAAGDDEAEDPLGPAEDREDCFARESSGG